MRVTYRYIGYAEDGSVAVEETVEIEDVGDIVPVMVALDGFIHTQEDDDDAVY
jgi:hypothetical protein